MSPKHSKLFSDVQPAYADWKIFAQLAVMLYRSQKLVLVLCRIIEEKNNRSLGFFQKSWKLITTGIINMRILNYKRIRAG